MATVAAKIGISKIGISLMALTAMVGSSAPASMTGSEQMRRSDASAGALLYVSVTDQFGRPVPGLQQADFTVWIENSPASINYFDAGDVPTAVGVLLDYSSSMKERGPSYQTLMKGLSTFAEHSNAADEFFIVAMGGNPILLTDWTQPGALLTADIEEAVRAKVKGPTALYDACDFAINKMHETKLSKRVLLMISTGADVGSKVSRTKLRRLLEESGIVMFSIGIADPLMDSLSGFGRSNLGDLTALSGGRVFFPGKDLEALESFTRIADEIRRQYAIGISLDVLKGDGKSHPVRVRVNPHAPVESEGKNGNRVRPSVLTRQKLFDAPRALS